jgi:putative ABC transport system permease protein
MKSISKGSLSSAIRTIRNNRARSLMTMIGIVIGVVAALVVVGIGVGVQRQVESQVSRLGKDLITVRAGDYRTANSLTDLGVTSPVSPLTARDVTAANNAGDVRSVTPLAIIDGTVSGDENGRFNGRVIGTTSDFADVLHQGLDFGSFFEAGADNAQMAVIGHNVAADLFQESVPLGRGFSFRGQEFVVVGILKPFETTPLLAQVDFNNSIFIPYDTAQSIANNSAPIFEMLVRPQNSQKVDAAVRSLNTALLRVHGGQQSFSVLKQNQSLSITNGILGLLSKLVLAAAATSLLVGGIGIMNIMWVSVAERMREVGIRKSVGATSRQILGQFLTEALVLTIGGWLLGVVLSVAIIWLCRLFTSLEPVVPWMMIGVSFVVTVATGVIFGSIPAFKAALKDPIDALRNE